MKYQKEFLQFLSNVKLIEDAERAEYELSDEIVNGVVLSGEIVGNDTQQKIVDIGRKFGLQVMACELSVLYRNV